MNYDPRAYWSDRARREGKKYVAYKNRPEAFTHQLDVFREEIDHFVPTGGKLLDFGCGVGRFAPFVRSHVDDYYGVDLTDVALRHTPEIEGCSFTWLKEDRLPFEDEFFDGAMAITVIQHIVDSTQFDLWLSELNRVVKNGGYFFVIDTPEPDKHVKRGMHMMWRTAKEISETLGATLEEERSVSAEFENSHYAFLARKK